MLSSNFYNCGLLVASSDILISQTQLIYNPREGQNTQGEKKKGNPIHLVLPSKSTHKLEITQRIAGERGPKERKEKKKSPQKDWNGGFARPAPPLPQSSRAGRARPGCWAAGTLAVLRPRRTLYLPSLAHRCARVSRTLGGSKRAERGSLGECSEPGGTRCLGMGTQRRKGSLLE